MRKNVVPSARLPTDPEIRFGKIALVCLITFDYDIFKYTQMAHNWMLYSLLQLRRAMAVSSSNAMAVSS